MAYTDLPAFNSGDILTAARMNQMRVNERIGHIVCTSTTRPGTPDTGTMIYETDTAKLLIYNGTAWVDVYPPAAVPTGVISSFGGATAPTGYLLCDGTSQSTTTYAALFAVVAYDYGGSGGSFTLPDLRGRAPVGAGTESPANAANAVPRTRGTKFGDTRLQSHTHTGSSTTGYMNTGNIVGTYVMSPGGHSWGANFGGLSGSAVFTFSPAAIHSGIYGGSPMIMNQQDVNHTHSFSFTSDNHNQGTPGTSANAPPSVGVNFIIKT